nr:MAG TPA: hypothetical protein [Bacteriophage sp.]
MIRDSRLQRLLNREHSSIEKTNLIERISVISLQLKVLMALVQMDSNLHCSGLLDLKEHHRDRRIIK